MKQEIKLLKQWLAKDGNTQIKLALKLGYTTQQAIQRWIERGSIAHLRKREVMKIIMKKSRVKK
jgi:hypothetical protein